MAPHTVLPATAAAILASLACHGREPARRRPAPATAAGLPLLVLAEDGAVAAWAVVEVKTLSQPKSVGFFRADAAGRLTVPLEPGSYALQITSPIGYTRAPAELGSSLTRVTVSRACQRSSGVAGGDIAPGDYVWLRSVPDGAYYGALVMADRSFSACLPPGHYTPEAHDDEQAVAFVFEPPGPVRFDAFEPGTIDTPAPETDTPPPATTSLLSALPPRVQVIGIGEANHGSREFLELRTTESLALAESGGARFIALEAGPAEVFPLDDYIHGRLPDVATHVAKLGYWMWDTQDMLRSLDRLRAYNATAPANRRVSLVGIDVQSGAGAAGFLLASDLTLTDDQRAALDTARHAQTLDDLDAPSALELGQRLSGIGSGDGPLSFRTEMALRQLRSRLKMYTPPGRSALVQRELGMADLITAVARHAQGSRVLIWAHNTHIGTDANSEYGPFGSRLRAAMGDRYLAVGLLMGRGAFRAWDAKRAIGVIPHTVAAPPAASFEAVLLRHFPRQAVFVRLDDVTEPLSRWIRLPRQSLENGGAMPEATTWPLRNHRASFDIVGFVPEVTPSTPTPTGERRAR